MTIDSTVQRFNGSTTQRPEHGLCLRHRGGRGLRGYGKRFQQRLVDLNVQSGLHRGVEIALGLSGLFARELITDRVANCRQRFASSLTFVEKLRDIKST